MDRRGARAGFLHGRHAPGRRREPRRARARQQFDLAGCDQDTTAQLRRGAEEGRSLLNLLIGAIYFFSHRPRALEVDTPFVNAAAEGTEFLVRVGAERAEVVMLDGQVLLQNPQGELRIASGQAAAIPAGAAPAPMIVARPRDAVAWALYYPPILAELAGGGAPPAPCRPDCRRRSSEWPPTTTPARWPRSRPCPRRRAMRATIPTGPACS